MDLLDKILILIIVIASIWLVYEMIPEEIPPSPDVPLNFSNFTSKITFTERTDQYGNLISERYTYHVYSNLNDNFTHKNHTVHIKAYDSNWNLLENISENVSLDDLDHNTESSDRELNYNYRSDELIDFKYVTFEIYEYDKYLCFNKTVEFNLSDINYQSRIDYYGGLVW